MRATIAIVLSALIMPSCLSFLARNLGHGMPQRTPIYPALNVLVDDIQQIDRRETSEIVLGGLLYIVDAPISFVLDTLLLPLDIVYWSIGWTRWPLPEEEWEQEWEAEVNADAQRKAQKQIK